MAKKDSGMGWKRIDGKMYLFCISCGCNTFRRTTTVNNMIVRIERKSTSFIDEQIGTSVVSYRYFCEKCKRERVFEGG